MRDWREGKTKHLVEYGEGRAIITFPFGKGDRTTVDKKCTCEFVPLLYTAWHRKSMAFNPGLRELH